MCRMSGSIWAMMEVVFDRVQVLTERARAQFALSSQLLTSERDGSTYCAANVMVYKLLRGLQAQRRGATQRRIA